MTDPTAAPTPTGTQANDREQVKKAIAAGADSPANRAKMHGALGKLLLRQQRFQQAMSELSQAIEIEPTNAGWRIARASALEAVGNVPAALVDASDAVMIEPQNAEYVDRLGTLLMAYRKFDEALLCFAEAIRLDGNKLEYYLHLSEALRRLDNLDAAVEIFEQLIDASPSSPEFYIASAELRAQQRRFEEATAIFARAIEQGAVSPALYRSAGTTHFMMGQQDKAMELFKLGLELAPNDEVLKHLLNASSSNTTDRVPESFIVETFKKSAPSYEMDIFNNRYRVPGLLRRELLTLRPKLDPERPAPHKLSAVLDLGCGTGLSGIMVMDLTAYMKGVDLSAEMIASAKRKQMYQELEIGEVLASLKADPRLYEGILGAGIMEYFGRLDEIMPAIYKRLLPNGFALLTFEGGPDGINYSLSAEGRFRHSKDYIEAQAEAAGFEMVTLTAEMLYSTPTGPVDGYFATLVRPLN